MLLKFDLSLMPIIVFRILLLAIVMFVAGCLGMEMAVPPGYASPLWPPAGIALSALLIWGRHFGRRIAWGHRQSIFGG